MSGQRAHLAAAAADMEVDPEDLVYEENNRLCLICSRSQIGPFEAPMISGDPAASSKCLKPQLWSTFVLRRILELPKRKFEKLLEASAGVSPGDWFKTCKLCNQLLCEAVRVHQQIGLLEKQLKVFQNQVRLRLKNSFGGSLEGKEEQRRKDRKSLYFSARNEIREYFRVEFLSPPKRRRKVRDEEDDERLNPWTSSDTDTDDNGKVDCDAKGDGNNDPLYSPEEDDDDEREYGKKTTKNNSHVISLPLKVKGNLFVSASASYSRAVCGGKSYSKKIKYQCPSCPSIFFKPHLLRLHVVRSHKKNYSIKKEPQAERAGLLLDESEVEVKIEPNSDSESEEPVVSPKRDHVISLSVNEDTMEVEGLPPRLPPAKQRNYSHKSRNIYANAQRQRKMEIKAGFRCDICNNWYAHKEMLTRHIEEHEKFGETTCTTCQYPCKSKDLLEVHVNEHHKLVGKECYYKCEKCGYTCHHPRYKHRHVHKFDDHILEDDDEMQHCMLCRAVFPIRNEIKLHMREMHGDKLGLRAFKCSMCPRSYHNLTHLKQHIDSSHLGKRRLHCEECGAGYMKQYDLEIHQLTHIAREERQKFLCDFCGKEYKMAILLKKHVQRYHKHKIIEKLENKEDSPKQLGQNSEDAK